MWSRSCGGTLPRRSTRMMWRRFDAMLVDISMRLFRLTLFYTGGGGGQGGAQSARANFKDSYLRNEHCYSNEISKPTFDNFNVKFLKMHFYFKFFIEMLNLNRIETFSMFLINFWLILRSF